MPDAYEIYEARYLGTNTVISAVNELQADSAAVPAGRVWTILSATAFTSVDDTQDFWFTIHNPQLEGFLVTLPTNFSMDVSASKYFPCQREGMELKLFPGEYLSAHRAGAAVGSTIGIQYRFIESPLPLYEEYEPQDARRRISTNRVLRRVGGIIAGPSTSGAGGGGERLVDKNRGRLEGV